MIFTIENVNEKGEYISKIILTSFRMLQFYFQRVIKGITPDIKSARVKAPPKKMKQNLSGKLNL